MNKTKYKMCYNDVKLHAAGVKLPQIVPILMARESIQGYKCDPLN